MLLKVVALTGNVGRDLHPVGQPHSDDLAQRPVRLLRGDGRDTRADAAPLPRGGTRFLRPWPNFKPGVVTFFFGRLRPFLTVDWCSARRRMVQTGCFLGVMSPPAADGSQILAVDVDGVISLFGFKETPNCIRRPLGLIDGIVQADVISIRAGERLNRLAEHCELVWRPARRTGPTTSS